MLQNQGYITTYMWEPQIPFCLGSFQKYDLFFKEVHIDHFPLSPQQIWVIFVVDPSPKRSNSLLLNAYTWDLQLESLCNSKHPRLIDIYSNTLGNKADHRTSRKMVVGWAWSQAILILTTEGAKCRLANCIPKNSMQTQFKVWKCLLITFKKVLKLILIILRKKKQSLLWMVLFFEQS